MCLLWVGGIHLTKCDYVIVGPQQNGLVLWRFVEAITVVRLTVSRPSPDFNLEGHLT
jgi:hypothetical protein